MIASVPLLAVVKSFGVPVSLVAPTLAEPPPVAALKDRYTVEPAMPWSSQPRRSA